MEKKLTECIRYNFVGERGRKEKRKEQKKYRTERQPIECMLERDGYLKFTHSNRVHIVFNDNTGEMLRYVDICIYTYYK